MDLVHQKSKISSIGEIS